MTVSYRYDHPTYESRKMFQQVLAAGTLTIGARFDAPQAIKLKGVYGYVNAAGTVSTALLRTIKISGTTTTTMGTGTAGTSAVNSRVDIITSEQSLAAGDRVYTVTVTDATLAANIVYEYEDDPAGVYLGAA